ncbi:hypothetical protein [Nostoc sp.]
MPLDGANNGSVVYADIDILREFYREDGIERLMAQYQNIEQIYK